MLAWLSIVAPVLTALGIIALLGLPAAFALRARGFAIAIITIPAAFAVMGITSLAAPALGVFWSIVPLVVVSAAFSLVLLLLRKVFVIRHVSSRNTTSGQGLWIPVCSAAIGGLAIATAVILSFKTPDAISQTYDVNFHLNAVRMILEEGSASPFDMDLSSPGSVVSYPALWHGFVTLIVQICGASIPLATNAALLSVVAVVWTIGMVGLGRAFAGPSIRVTVISGILSVAIPSFPLALTGYGILYPNLLSFALIPYFLIGFMQFFALAQARRSDVNSPGSSLLLIFGSIGAVMLAHPNGLHSVLVWMIGPSIYLVVRAFRRVPVMQRDGALRPALLPPTLRKAFAVCGFVSLIVLVYFAWLIGRTFTAPWGGDHKPLGAALDAIGMSPHLEGHAWPLTVLFIVGFISVILLKKLRWTVITGMLFLGLYIISDGFPPAEWRTFFLTPWYNTPWRLSALAWMGLFPFLVMGASTSWSILRGGIIRWTRLSQRPKLFYCGASVLAALFLLASTQGAGAHAGIQYVSSKYESSGEAAYLLDNDERAILERLPETLPADAVIISNPWNGSALAYAIAGVPVLTPHASGNYDPRITELSSELKYGTPRACELVDELNAHYVLDFGTKYVFQGTKRAVPFLGVTDVSLSDMFTELDREGEAVLYEVTGCDSNQ
ncbi:DUF6541 family protein [Leucobacter sp. 1207-22]|uniref:DUF6541 family protein n=1 Tax=Leucobacter sp. 1207-22 TaxID=2604456 RepID=UPI004063C2E2